MTHRTRRCIDSFVMLFLSLSLLTLIGASPNVASNKLPSSAEESQLKLVHVVFGHKLLAPLGNDDKYEFPEKLDYRYFLENTWDMPNEYKMDMFNLGMFLRQRYDEFLGAIYYPEVMKMRTSGYFVSMISGLLVNAGLWPPAQSQKWKDDLDWQPIPTDYEQIEKDALFLGSLCPRFRDEEILMLQDNAINAEISVHKPFFDYVTSNYGKTVEHPSEIAQLYSCFETIATDRNATLPSWAESIFPDGEMRNVSLLSYDLLSRSNIQKQLNGGGFINKILEESMKIVAENNTFIPGANDSRDFKISMYSGEERNVIGVLRALNLWSTPHIPESGASVIFELRHDTTHDVYGFEILYYTGVENNETITLDLPGCSKFCPLNDFARILSEVLPADENLLCHATMPINKEKTESSGHSLRQRSLYLSHFFVPFIALLFSKF